MSLLRFIARLDIKGPQVVKGIRFEGLRKIGDPQVLAEKYAEDADELLYLDTVATLYGRNQLEDLLERTTERVFIPVTVGGGIASLGDVKRLLNAGADKIALNSAAVRRPSLINEIADKYGNQCVVVSVEAKRVVGGWEAYTDNGRERTGQCALRWAHEAVERGAGELLVTSIDADGTMKGFDCELMSQIQVPVPVVASGGMGSVQHAKNVLEFADAVCMGSCLHFDRVSFKEMRDGIAQREFPDQGHFAGRKESGPEGRVS